MCGIVAAVADRNIIPVLLEGLRKLEYRGYDSAGLAFIDASGLHRLRSVGRVAELAAQAEDSQAAGDTGIAHTRWATHGVPCERNAHPHISAGLAVVHNGIIENHESLRGQLRALGYVFTSDTDTEVVAHLIAHELTTTVDLLSAVRQAIAQLQGAYAIAVLRESEPERLVDTLIVGAFIEARSCERFAALVPHLDNELAKFYAGLLESEGRHYQGYLQLALLYGDAGDVAQRIEVIRQVENHLIASVDEQFRFHSGLPA